MLDTLYFFADPTQYDRLQVAGKWELQTTADEMTGTIKSEKLINNEGGIHSHINLNGTLKFHTSAPKILYGDSIHEVNESDYSAFCDKVSSHLRGLGIKTELEKLPLSRVDYCKNMNVTHPVYDYLSILSGFSLPRTDKEQFEHSVKFGNKSRCLIAYDKVEETLFSARKNRDVGTLSRYSSFSGNILRLEGRLFRRRVIRKLTGSVSPAIREIWSKELSSNYLLNEFNSVLNESSRIPYATDIDGMIQVIRQAREVFSRGSIYRLASVRGSGEIVRACGGFEQFKECLMQAGYNERSVRRILSRFRKEFCHSVPQDSMKLLDEIRTKLVA